MNNKKIDKIITTNIKRNEVESIKRIIRTIRN